MMVAKGASFSILLATLAGSCKFLFLFFFSFSGMTKGL